MPLFNQVSAELIPESSSRVKVQFKQFKVSAGSHMEGQAAFPCM